MPDEPNTADTLGWVLFRRGVPSAAIGYLKEAEAGVKPEDATLGDHPPPPGAGLRGDGDKENARRTLDRAIDAHEAFVEAQKARGVPVGADPTWYTDARKMRERLCDRLAATARAGSSPLQRPSDNGTGAHR